MELIESKYNDKLNSLIPQFNKRGIDLGLERIKNALDELGNPCCQTPAIHIAGTNGKGSIASFLQSALNSSGIKAGVTTSPHLINWCERISINKKNISSKTFIEIIEDILPLSERHNLTPFELIIVTALKYFEYNNVEIIVLETGLGGRLDATTAHPFRPLIAFGGIGLDHCEYLGNNLSRIAKEKAAIITHGSTVISSNQNLCVKKLLEEEAYLKKAELKWVKDLSKDWKLGIKGDIQRKNAAVAKSTLESLVNLGFNITNKKIREGFELASWPGRLQQIYWNGLPLLLDGAHNPHAAIELSNERKNWEGEKNGIYWILAIQDNKDGPLMIKHLIKPNDICWILDVPDHQSWNREKILEANPKFSEQLFEAKDIESIFSTINKENFWPDPIPVIAGSLYIIGDILRRLSS